ncbi:hypothetical protein [Amycolatopsis jejuensis]|uniref:hypothetical protein n=1 Tax=Amycolatopsis jejuensis TaxID=330084 RepID=UPI000525D121|nr:hypothetical protein [Amycolatopsis jejuensis]
MLLLLAFAGLALPVSAPGAGAAQPAGTGNVLATTAEPRAAVVARDGEGGQPDQQDDDWIPLLCLAGVLIAAPVGYFAYTRREAA